MRVHRVVFVSALVLFTTWAAGCGSETTGLSGAVSGDAATDAPTRDAGGFDSTTTFDASVDAFVADTSTVDASDASDATAGCVANLSCNTNPGVPCRGGVTACTDGGSTCVDGPAVSDGTSCSAPDGGAALCSGGACLLATTVSTNKNLSSDSLTPGRTCAEAPAYSVTGLTSLTATTAVAPAGDCLAPGDEVLLVNLQGTPAATTNVGNWELLEIATVASTTVTFTKQKLHSYGAAAATDTNIGTGATDQKVALVRVPHFGELTVASGKTITAAGWNGALGGVVALRAGKVTVDGAITAAALGFRSGRWSRDSQCTDNVATEAGESYTGPALASLANNGGGPGGLSALTGVSFNSNTPTCSTAGHAAAGTAGRNPDGRTVGSAGAAYGTNDATKLTMGSGNSGNLTCDAVSATALLPLAFPTTAGGIVLLMTGQLDVGATGEISARAVDESRDTAASGGYVFIQGGTLHLGASRVTATGANATAVNGPFSGTSIKASDGYVVLKAVTITGTTTPVANVLP